MASRWSDATLEAARQEGDPEADRLIEQVLGHTRGSKSISRGGYNHLLDLANVLIAHPELSLVKSSLLRKQLDEAGYIGSFFDPMEAPDWVDEAKLARAAELWQTDSLLCIAVLYAASLPACYLMKRGVPALYATDKLSEQKYVFQRIFETGVMLEGVMSPGGIEVIHDVEPNTDAVMANALNTLDPEGQWGWQNHRLHRSAGAAASPVDPERAQQHFAAAHAQARRYIWGSGFVAARKVRFLHAAMRCMILNPSATSRISQTILDDRARSFVEHASHRTAPWDVQLGKPINQEDLAYVLLTFGYLIPKGMDIWGRTVPREQKEAFLHLWRVVGHSMGLREDLMTDNLDEAEALYEQILARNIGESEPGRILTTAIMDFLRGYLPTRFGLSTTVPAALIVDQLGLERAKVIISDAELRPARQPFARAGHAFARSSIKLYYWLRRNLLSRLPIVGPGVATITEHAAEALIDSWRDAFMRKPFYVPAQATTWVLQKGVTPEFEASLETWRLKLFDTMAAGLGGLIIAGFAFAAALLFLVMDLLNTAKWTGFVSVVTLGVSVVTLRWVLPSIAKQRPVLTQL